MWLPLTFYSFKFISYDVFVYQLWCGQAIFALIRAKPHKLIINKNNRSELRLNEKHSNLYYKSYFVVSLLSKINNIERIKICMFIVLTFYWV